MFLFQFLMVNNNKYNVLVILMTYSLIYSKNIDCEISIDNFIYDYLNFMIIQSYINFNFLTLVSNNHIHICDHLQLEFWKVYLCRFCFRI
jgi:hypothetical protein